MPSSRCIVSNCDGIHLALHYLPLNEARRLKWLQALGREDLIEKPYTTLRSFKVCGNHFDVSNYRSAESFMLNRNALPISIKKEETAPTTPQPENKEDVPPRIYVGKKYKCIVKNCKVTVKPFHHLPRRMELREKWLRNVDRMDIIEIPYDDLGHRGVCGTHFDPSQYYFPGSTRLLRTAVPRPLKTDEDTSKNELTDSIEDLLKDAPISTGTVTEPLLCHNKVLLKTKSTYSKHKYKMTFKEDDMSSQIIKPQIKTAPQKDPPMKDLPLEISDVFEVSDDEDFTSNSNINSNSNNSNSNINNAPTNVKPLPSTKPVKPQYVSILKKNQTNSKKRKYIEIEKEPDFDEYDNKLFSILEEVKSLPNFLDIIFGFLYRRTDYFETSSDQNIGIGLPNGVAQKLVWQAFKKYENKNSGDVSTPRTEETVEEQTKASQELVATTSSKENKNEKRLFKTYNGAVFENYAWSQTISDVDIQIKIPDKVTCKQLHIDISYKHLTIKLKDSETVYLTGDLCKRCRASETVWSLGGQILQIHLEKQFESWWDCLLKAEPRLDFSEMDLTRSFQELSKEHERKIQQLSRNEISFEEIVDINWKVEESAFVEEYDPLIELSSLR